MIGNGYKKAEIGVFLFISPKTVCKHIINAQLKADLNSMNQIFNFSRIMKLT